LVGPELGGLLGELPMPSLCWIGSQRPMESATRTKASDPSRSKCRDAAGIAARRPRVSARSR
jgi:hypothetical protein